MSKTHGSQVITCKAAVCWGDGEPVKVEEIQVDPPKSSEIRIKMLCASLCHTDVLCYRGFPFPLYPRVLGHEGVGVVESIGDKVREFKEGDLVIPAFIGECQECENCRSGKTNYCLKHPITFHGLMPDCTSRMSIRGQKLYHLFTCSTWVEYTVVDANYVVNVDPSLNLAHLSLLSCGFSTGFGSAWKEAVEKGSTVAVIGLGAVGLGAIEAARLKEATKIIGVDKNQWKKEKGQAFGMTDFIYSDGSGKPISELIKDTTGGLGVDYCFECTGVTSLISQALQATKIGAGKTIAVGGAHDLNVPLSFAPILCGGTLKGCIFGGLKIKSDLPILLDKCKKKEFHLDELLTHEVSLEGINEAFQLIKQQDCVKVLIKID